MEKFEIAVFILFFVSLLIYPALFICLIWGVDVEILKKLLISNVVVTLVLGAMNSALNHD